MTNSTNQQRIAALPTDQAALQRLVLGLQDQVASHEQARREREAAAEELAASPAADFAVQALPVKADLEALADGSEDYEDPRTRTRIVRAATTLIDQLVAALRQ